MPKKGLTKKWWSLELSKIDNNIAFTPQFEYNLGKNETKYLEFYYQFSGWYQVNNVLSDCYYTEKFSDSTFVEIHPIYKKFELIGKVGYSFMGESLLYSYGFDYTNKYLKLIGNIYKEYTETNIFLFCFCFFTIRQWEP